MNSIRELYPFLKRYRNRILLALVVTALVTGLSLLPPMVLRVIMDDVFTQKAWGLLVALVLVYTLLPIMVSLLAFLRGRMVVVVGRRVMNDVRLRLYQRLLQLPMRYHNDNSVGSMVQRLMSDTTQVLKLLTGQAIQIAQDLAVFILSVGVCFYLSWHLALALCVMIALYISAYHFFARRIERNTKLYRAITDQIAGRLQESINGIRQVRIYNRECDELNLFLQQTTASLDKSIASGLNTTGLGTVCTAIANIGSHLINAIGTYMVMTGRITYGDLLALCTYMGMALAPALRLTTIAGELTEVGVSFGRIFEILKEKPDIVSDPGAPELHVTNGHVNFSDMTFSYVPEKPLFQHFNLDVPGGTMVAFVGHTGCGKTTITSLLMRYWDVQGGRVLIDEQDIRQVDLNSLQRAFGVVLQEPVVFEGTLMENIAYGTRHPDPELVMEAAIAAELGNTIARLPDGLHTVLGTYGVKLSLGEKQRVSIARAILRNPAILVMDEATSALDSESEALIQKALERLLSGRTSFVVAHRLSTISGADMIVVLDEGQIVEKGSHAELMSIENGAYRKLYEELRRAGEAGVLQPCASDDDALLEFSSPESGADAATRIAPPLSSPWDREGLA